MVRKRRSERFKISLYENGVHSLKQGLKAYQDYRIANEPIKLKDAIMGIHHGVELLLKEMLVEHNQFLIFRNLRNVAKKQKQADDADVGIFFIENPPRTVSFIGALNRVDAFLTPDPLDANLINLLEELNSYRNQLEHYAVDADIDEVARLVSDIQDPLLSLLETELGEISELRQDEVEEAWSDAKKDRKRSRQFEEEILELVDQFSGQKIPGKYFNIEREIVLPEFHKVLSDYRIPDWPIQSIDIFAMTSDGKSWAVEVKNSLGRGKSGSNTVQNIRSKASFTESIPWIVLRVKASDNLRSICREFDVLLSDNNDLQFIRSRFDQLPLFNNE